MLARWRSAVARRMRQGRGMADDAALVEALRAEVRQLRAQQVADRAEIAALRAANGALVGQVESRDRVLADALEQQTATAEILRVIASSPMDLRAVMQVIVESAVALC